MSVAATSAARPTVESLRVDVGTILPPIARDGHGYDDAGRSRQDCGGAAAAR
jgi:hypothetical protein